MRIGMVTRFVNGVGTIEDLGDRAALVTFHVGDLATGYTPKPGDRVGYEVATTIGAHRVSCSKVWAL